MRNLGLPVAEPDAILHVRGLIVTYVPAKGDPVHALRDVSLDVYSGEALGILGESGCGKSTLGAAMLQLLPPHARVEGGEIIFKDRNLLKLREKELRPIRGREISLISQDPALALNPVLAVGTQISEVLRAHLALSSKQRRERVHELLKTVGFEQPGEIYHAYPHQLSGGQRQRIVIAQAVACGPSLIIADEPTSKLDASLRGEITGLLRKVREQYGTAVVLISHDAALLAGFADRIAVMYEGKVVDMNTCAELFQRPTHSYSKELIRLAGSFTIDHAGTKEHFPVMEGSCLQYGG